MEGQLLLAFLVVGTLFGLGSWLWGRSPSPSPSPSPVNDDTTLQFGSLHLDVPGHRVTLDEVEVALTPREFDVLVFLAEAPGTVRTRQDFEDKLGLVEPTLTSTISELRKKISPGDTNRYITTKHKIGYVFSNNFSPDATSGRFRLSGRRVASVATFAVASVATLILANVFDSPTPKASLPENAPASAPLNSDITNEFEKILSSMKNTVENKDKETQQIINDGVERILASVSGYDARSQTDSTYTTVKNRGHLICGINGEAPGMSEMKDIKEDSQVSWNATGFEADLCRAVAIAIFGTDEQTVKFRRVTLSQGPTAGKERYRVLRDREVDLVIYSVTWDSLRDVENGVDFCPVVLFDTQKFVSMKNSDIKVTDDLEGKRICLTKGTTANLDSVNAMLASLGISDWKPVQESDVETPFKTIQAAFDGMINNKCDAVISDEIVLRGLAKKKKRHGLKTKIVYDFNYFPKERLSLEPLVPAVRENDSEWRDIVTYTINVLIYAAQKGISSNNVDDKPKFCEKTWAFLKLKAKSPQKIIKTLGNYHELHKKHFGKLPAVGEPNGVKQEGDRFGLNPGPIYSPACP